MKMNIRNNYIGSAIAAVFGASMLALSVSSASALTISNAALSQSLASSSQVDLASWHGDRGFGHHGGEGWRWHDRGHWGHNYWGNGYWDSGYEYPVYQPSPCRIFGGELICP
jgi:hypothetical protein